MNRKTLGTWVMFAAIAVCAIAGPAHAVVPTDWATAGGAPNVYVFYFQLLHDNTIISMLGTEYAALVALFLPGNADLNGSSYVDTRNGTLFGLGGNGMNDPYYELKLAEVVLKNTAFNVNGLTHQMVSDAYIKSDNQFKIDVGNSYWTAVLPLMVDGLGQILKGEMLIGDGDADYSIPDYVTCTGSAGFIKAVLSLLGDYIPNPQIDLNLYGRLPQYFAKDGDADGDGASNWCEFTYYKSEPQSANNTAYYQNALNPAVFPAGCQDPLLHFLRTLVGGWFEEGSAVTLDGSTADGVPTVAYQWSKNGTPIAGETLPTLNLAAVTPTDSGLYTIDVTDSRSASEDPPGPIHVTQSALVTIIPMDSLPVANLAGLCVLLGCVTAIGGLTMAVRKARARA